MEWHVWRAGARKAPEGCLDSSAVRYVHASNNSPSIPIISIFFFSQWSFTHVQRPSYKSNDPGRRRSKARCRRPPAKRHAPPCTSLQVTLGPACNGFHGPCLRSARLNSRKSQLPKSSCFEQPTEFRFLQQCAVLDPAEAALQRPHKPPSSAALGASDPNPSLNQLAVSTAVSGWVGCASA